MATVMASKPQAPFGKMKRPSGPYIQTNTSVIKAGNTSPPPSSATKRLPGQTQPPVSATSNPPSTNGIARPNRRLQRVTTRTNTTDNAGMERRNITKDPEPYVPSEAYILKRFRGQPPSLTVHLHPTHFRFDQQDGSFSYHSEMRLFIEHLQKKTIPHDMLEELRKEKVRFYNGWLIVRIIDHKSVATAAATNHAGSDDEKPFSIDNYNPYITPSPYAPYPAKEQSSPIKSPVMKLEGVAGSSGQQVSGDSSSTVNGEPRSDDTNYVSSKTAKPQPKIFHVALRPTVLSKHMDLVLDSMMADPKTALNRRQSQVFGNSRTPASATMGAPPTPLSNLPTTPGIDKGPASKKRKLRIDPRDLLDYEARIINLTAPPLLLDPVESLEEAQDIMLALRDPLYDAEPPSPKSRKRTVAELAADDALAKEQERFMLIMAERGDGGGAVANANVADAQAAGALFQPDFGKFNTIQTLKFQAAERQKREEERKMHEDANRRAMEEERKRHQVAQQQEMAQRAQAQQRQQQQRLEMEQRKQAAMAEQQARQVQAQQMQAIQQQQQHHAQMTHASVVNGVPPSMQNQLLQAQMGQRSSPIIRQSTPHGNSSPVITNTQGVPMATTGSGQGMAGSPPRPGSAMQHGHPGISMTRGPSNQGPSRNGTPQIPHGTPAMRQDTPVMRQGTPSQRMSQASPHAAMMAPTPQMSNAGMMAPGQMPNGQGFIPQNVQQVAAMNARHLQAQAMAQLSQANGGAQMAHLQAQRHASHDQQAAMQLQFQREQQRRQQAQQQQQMQQAGTPQQHIPPSPAGSAQSAQNQYSQNLRQALQNQMQGVQAHGSPPNHATPQQQMAQMAQQQRQGLNPQQMAAMQAAQLAQAQGQQMPNGFHPQQQRQQMAGLPTSAQQAMARVRDQQHKRYIAEAAQKYGGNAQAIPQPEQQEILNRANKDATNYMRNQMQQQQNKRKQQMMMQQQQQQQQQQQGGQGMSPQQQQFMMQQMAAQAQQGQGGHGQMSPQQAQQMFQTQQIQAMMQQQAGGMQQMTPQQQAFLQQAMAQQQQQQQHGGGQLHGLPGNGVMPK